MPWLYNNFESIKKRRGFYERYPRKVTLNLKIPKNQKQWNNTLKDLFMVNQTYQILTYLK